MADISAKMVKELRDRTGSGIMDSKKALVATDGDMDAAVDWLRENGILKAEKKAGRVAAEGMIESYIHGDGKVGVLVEVNTETDFAAQNTSFREFVHEVALQIAAMSPKWVSREEVPEDIVENEKSIYEAEAKNAGKPDKIIDNIVKGKLEKFYSVNCLLEQEYIRDDSKTIKDMLVAMIAEIGENIVIRRFTRYELGEGIEVEEEDFAAEVEKELNK